MTDFCLTQYLLALIIIMSAGCAGRPAQAFPPYKSTDADTAEPQTIEARLGTQFESRDGDSDILVPRVRLNFGLPNKVEIATEFDYSSSNGKPDDGAMGVKWIPFTSESINLGIEALGLLPVHPGLRGFGTETQVVATIKENHFLVHLNAGGFYDPREAVTMSGWRASGLLEIPIDNARLGFELFAKKPAGKRVDARTGIGAIVGAGQFDIRAGVHLGISAGAPAISLNLWISRTFSLL